MQNSFQSGDYVRTSKGKIGVIEKAEGFSLFSGKTLFGEYLTEEQCQYIIDLFLLINFKKELLPNQVKLGDRIFPINSDKLTRLDTLRIRTQQGLSQFQIELPIEDALTGYYSKSGKTSLSMYEHDIEFLKEKYPETYQLISKIRRR